MIYLISQLWPFMLAAGVVGVVVGWRAAARCRDRA